MPQVRATLSEKVETFLDPLESRSGIFAAWIKISSRICAGNHVILRSDFEGKRNLDLPTNCIGRVLDVQGTCDALGESCDVPRSPRTPVGDLCRQGIRIGARRILTARQ
jgi:hypothetical protein